MITRKLSWGSLALVMMVSGSVARAPAGTVAEQAVTAAEYQWLKSQQTNNVELLAPLLADNIVMTSEEDKVLAGKDAVLADAQLETWSSVEYTNLKVTVFGDTAIATGAFVAKGMSAAGKPLHEQIRFTDTWVKTAQGNWLCIATHDTPLKTLKM